MSQLLSPGRLIGRLDFEPGEMVEALVEDEDVDRFRVRQRQGRDEAALSKLGQGVKLAAKADIG
jgi:hypothetical protein